MATIKRLDESFNPQEYNTFAHHPLQSWQWGEARKQMGLEVIRIGEYENGELVNVYQMSIHPLGHFPYKIGYLPRSVNPSRNVLEYLLDFGRENKLIFIKIEPYAENSKFKTQNSELVLSPHALFPPWTQTLDISISIDELLKKMKSKTRYNIRLAQKKGVTVKEISTSEGFETFQKLYFDTCKRQKYYGHTKKYHTIVWDSMKEGTAHILIAFYNNIPLASYELFHFKDTLYYTYGGTAAEHRNLMAANLLMWEAILLGKKLGAERFDMWGSLPPAYDNTHPWAGFTRFKEGYGTTFIHLMESRDLVVNKPLYLLYNIAYKLREMYLGLRKLV